MVLTEQEKKLIVTIRQYVPKGFDVEVRGNKNGTIKILKVKKNVVNTE